LAAQSRLYVVTHFQIEYPSVLSLAPCIQSTRHSSQIIS